MKKALFLRTGRGFETLEAKTEPAALLVIEPQPAQKKV
jgi:hypothetical protein